MKDLRLVDIEKGFGAETLFEEVNLVLSPGDHVAIIGDNGVGKSTLMKIMAGLEDFDDGNVVVKDWVERRYVSQEYLGDGNITPEELFKSESKPGKAYDIAKQLGLNKDGADLVHQTMKSLSGGQQRIVELASALAATPHFLFIDEPENHLDLVARTQLTELLKDYRGCVCLVSHDRYLVNEFAEKIIEVANKKVRLVSGMTYEQFRDMQRREFQGEQRQWVSEKKKVEQLEKAVHIMKKQAFRGTNTATYQRRKKELEERKASLIEDKPNDKKRIMRPESIKVDRKSGKLIVTCDDVSLQYPGSDNPLFTDVNLDLRFGDKRVILGRNGSGKTSLIELLLKKREPTTGTIRFGNDIVVELFEQKLQLDPSLTPLKLIQEKTNELESGARAILGRYAFTKAQMDTPINQLSGGQKARLRFALTFSKKPEFLILDEPTNNLDPDTWDVLAEHVASYPGTMVIISHDRAFIEYVNPDKYWVIHKHTVKESGKTLEELMERIET